MKIAKVNESDVYGLAHYITELDGYGIEADKMIIDESLQSEFGCNLQQFTHIIQRLLPMIEAGVSTITKKRYKGFADAEKGVLFVGLYYEI